MAAAEFDLLPIIDQACIAMSRSETTSAQISTLGPCLRMSPSASVCLSGGLVSECYGIHNVLVACRHRQSLLHL